MDKDRKLILSTLLLAGIFSLVFCNAWKASVTKSLEALVSSCVVVPCSFTHPAGDLPTSRLRGIWHYSETGKRDQNIYHDDKTKILDSFKGRTQLLGEMGQNNCTLEIMDVKDHDNGPFCFRIELVKDDTNQPTDNKFSFVEDCAEIKMLEKPPKPELQHSNTATEGKPYVVTCSVYHTCPSHMPKLTWSRGADEEVMELHHETQTGKWRMTSILTFTPNNKDDAVEVNCTATFNGGKTSFTSFTLNVKGTPNNNHIIIPVAVATGTAVLFGLLCIFMVKKYQNRISELQRQEGSMWNRLSRMSRRFRSGDTSTARFDATTTRG